MPEKPPPKTLYGRLQDESDLTEELLEEHRKDLIRESGKKVPTSKSGGQ